MGPDDDAAEAATLVQPRVDPGPADDGDLAPGVMVGRYRLIARLGAGAMGVVWSAQDPQLDRRVAIKVVHPALVRAAEASERMLREARAMAKVSHRAVVTIHDAGDVDGRLFLAMELVTGTTLGQLLRERAPDARADWPRWLAMMLEAGSGLAAAHREGVLHRDFKPDNVLVSLEGRVCVGDFGLAALGEVTRASRASRARIDWQATPSLDLTTTGALIGTPGYMSPQQLQGGDVDARADQFGFCVATYEALYGERPFAVTHQGLAALTALVEQIESGALPAVPAGSPVPERVRDVLRRGLAADPDARWPDMAALLDALDQASGLGRRRTPAVRPRVVRYVAGALGVAVAAVAIAVIARRTATPAQAVTPPVVPPSVTAKRLFGVSMRTTMAISPDGQRLALGSDRLEIRSLAGAGSWVLPLDERHGISYVELGPSDVRFALAAGEVQRWRYRDGQATELVTTGLVGRWYGRTAFGDLVYAPDELRIVDAGRIVKRRALAPNVVVYAISPDGRRVAFIESDRFTGRIQVWDLERDIAFASATLVGPTAVSWLDPGTLVYATGTQDQPAIHRVAVGPDAFGATEKLYGMDSGWFAELRAHRDQVYAIEMSPTSRARIIEQRRDGRSVRDFDQASVAVPLGWAGPDEFLAWNRSSQVVWRMSSGAAGAPTLVRLEGEPANATLADDIVIVALRRGDGRETVALAPSGAVLWRHADRKTLAVRCAGDRHPPCFAIRIAEGHDDVLAIDPRTGELARAPLHRGNAEDLAVSEDGQRLLVAAGSEVHELDAAGALVAKYATPLVSTRSLAFDPGGGFLVAGTLMRNVYQVGRVRRGVFSVLAEADNDIVSLVRPSFDGTRVLVLARVFSPEVWQLQLR